MSASEKLLWKYLRRNGRGYKFVRQYRIGPFFLDFYCPQIRFAIEVDGEQHLNHQERDAKKDRLIESDNILLLRIPSVQLWGEGNENAQSWAEKIEEICWAREVSLGERSPTPSPSPFSCAKGGGEPEA